MADQYCPECWAVLVPDYGKRRGKRTFFGWICPDCGYKLPAAIGAWECRE
uniref:Uncharacterized protein n=1 Tax=viral metagenome TaxID=1070528 RepID=A0A6M3JGX0_9ZZZZ